MSDEVKVSRRWFLGGALAVPAAAVVAPLLPVIPEVVPEVAEFDPVLIALVRRSMPNIIAHDIIGVQPMTGPTGQIFALKSRYSANS